jgi:hypothetical protein
VIVVELHKVKAGDFTQELGVCARIRRVPLDDFKKRKGAQLQQQESVDFPFCSLL